MSSTSEEQADSTDELDRFEFAAQQILTDQLPVPVRQRWQPLRVGLMNVFLFEDERFPFADGRLLLRGSNGAGKSRVLAMTLPLLLDGSFKATRVEPDRDPNRQVAWNLLMDDQPSATGYSWLEFGRIDEAGKEHFVTVGCGMRANRGQRIKPWFFITELRIDDSLDLKSADRVPLTLRQLQESLADAGDVFETATEYRRAVDERLFRLGERYDPLIDLLLQLRQPKLAEKLDIDQLEAALREALPPLPESLLDDAAEAFRDLDDYRNSLASDRRTLEDIQRFLKPYLDHVRRGVKRSLKSLTTANSRYDTAQRDLKKLTEQKLEDQTALAELSQQQQQLKVEIKAGQAAISELMQSPEMQDAKRLDDQKKAVQRLTEQLKSNQSDLEAANVELSQMRQRVELIQVDVQQKRQTVEQEADKCRNAVAPESLQNQHQEQLKTFLASDSLDRFSECKKILLRAAKRFQKSAEHLIQLNVAIDQQRASLNSVRETVQRHEQEQLATQESLETARQQRDQLRDDLWQAILNWYEQPGLLRTFLPAIDSWADRWNLWEAESHQTDPSNSIVSAAQSLAINAQISAQERCRHQLEEIEVETSLLNAERQRLETGAPIVPPLRSHRAGEVAARGEGIFFWKLVEFKPGVPERERGNWESALHDAGLLDAVLLPDGRLVTESSADDASAQIQLAHSGMSALEEKLQLAQVLQPADEAAFANVQPALQQVLRVIGVGRNAGATWVANDGSWRNGPLHGRLSKPQPQYIGKGIRDRWRKIRIEELAAEIKSLEQQNSELAQEIADADEACRQIELLVAAFPANQPLLTSAANVTVAQRESDLAVQRLVASQQAESEALRLFDEATTKRDEDAADCGLIAWAVRSIELRDRLNQYVAGLDTLDARIETARTVFDQANESLQAVARAESREHSAGDRVNATQVELGVATETVRVLQDSAGHDVAMLMKRLDAQRQQQGQRSEDAEKLAGQLSGTTSSLAVIESRLAQLESDSSAINEQRREATQWFSMLHEQHLIEFVCAGIEIPELPWSMTAALKLARQVDTLLANVASDDESWLSSQSRLHKAQNELQQTALSQDGLAVEVEPLRDGLQMVTLMIQGERLAPPTAVQRLDSEITTRERILDEKEQDTLEKYLLGEVAEGLRKGMRMAAELVEVMTSEVSKRPMKTGMQMRFKWRRDDDGPTGLKEACEVLATDAATWSPDEREQIKVFLQRSIRQQREIEQAGSWHDHMRSALDYRLWHRIVIERRSGPDANWLRLTRRTYAGGSGGEKAIALTLPPLAAAAAYYRSADPLAPRFILLDEAFAGISSDMRESCMELISAFGLDLVMTSESEWGQYASVKQLAICQLDRFSDINAVVNRVFVWNGSEKRQMVSSAEATERNSQPLLQDD